MADILKELRRAVDTGSVDFGSNDAVKHARNGDTKAIICASNLPNQTLDLINHYASMSKVLVLQVDVNGIQLGEVCGKPFACGCVSVQDTGHSKIVEVLKAQ